MGLPFTKYWGGLKQKVPKSEKISREDFENKKAKVTRVTLENKKENNGANIVQISGMHGII